MLNLAVGPVMMENEILAVGSEQIPYFRTEEFSELMLENEKMLLKLINAPQSSRNIFLTASGTAAMEAVIMNTLSKEDKVLVINGGSFGSRFKKICDIHGLNATEIKIECFDQITENQISIYDDKGYTALLVNMHETSTGVLYDMDLIKKFCSKNNILLIVDAISSFLADKYNMSDLGANVTILSSQKALALPPGMSYVIVDKLAQQRIKKNYVKSLYFDLKDYLKDGVRGQTPYTPSVGGLIQLNKRLNTLLEIGTENATNSVSEIAVDFRSRIGKYPFQIATKYPSNALTSIKPYGKMNAKEIVDYLRINYEIFILPSGGDLSDIVFRVGHIGAITRDDTRTLLRAFDDMLNRNIL